MVFGQRGPRRLVPLLMIAAVIAASAIVGVSTASADRKYCTPNGAGCIQFDAATNNIYVCDEAADGFSVVGEYGLSNEADWHLLVNYWGHWAYNGCYTWTVKPHGAEYMDYTVCLANNGVPGGARMVPVAGSCHSPVFHDF